ncbi:MAG: ThuA domain-containing protein [Bryobacteraceae bacterium]
MKSFPILTFACAVVGLALGQSGPPAPQPAKLQVLIITGQNSASHDWRSTTPMLRKILEDSGRFEVRVTEEFRGDGADTLAPYDVVLVNYYESKRADLRWGDSADNALLNFVHGGKGLVVYHFSLAAFEGWTEYEKICAGNWRPNNGHHSARHDFKVTVQDSDHPITRGLKTTFAEANDELYANLKWQPAAAFHVLATAWDDHSLYRQGEKQPLVGPGAAEPMLWTVNYGKGRVFITAMGHDTEAMKNAGFAVTLARGTEWAATGKVTIPVPPELKQAP